MGLESMSYVNSPTYKWNAFLDKSLALFTEAPSSYIMAFFLVVLMYLTYAVVRLFMYNNKQFVGMFEHWPRLFLLRKNNNEVLVN